MREARVNPGLLAYNFQFSIFNQPQAEINFQSGEARNQWLRKFHLELSLLKS